MGTQHFKQTVKNSLHSDMESHLDRSNRKGRQPTRQFNLKPFLQILSHSKQPSSLIAQPDIVHQIKNSNLKRKEEQLNNLKQEGPVVVKLKGGYPYSAVGVVHGFKTMGNLLIPNVGTGCIIGPHLILTCAHNCYWRQKKQMYKNIQFIPSLFETHLLQSQLAGKGFKVKEVYIPKQYFEAVQKQDSPDEEYLYDYALLLIEDFNLENYFGSFGLDFQWQTSKQYQQTGIIDNLKIIGYKPGKKVLEMNQFRGNALADANFLLHCMKTQRGISGSPIFSQTPSGCTIRGIHQRVIRQELVISSQTHLMGALKVSKKMFDDVQKHFLTGRVIHSYNLSQQQLKSEEDIISEITQLENSLKDKDKESIMVIDLTYNEIGEQGSKLLIQGRWKNLHTLDLTFNNIGPQGCENLAKGEYWPNLKLLLLAFNHVGDKGCDFISKGEWPKLTTLDLTDNKIYHPGCFLLAKGPWPNLQCLKLISNQIGKQGFGYFKARQWDIECDEQFRSSP